MGKRSAFGIPKGTNTHSDYVISFAFPLQQWLHELASMLRYTYIACLFKSISVIYFAYIDGSIIYSTWQSERKIECVFVCVCVCVCMYIYIYIYIYKNT